MIALGSWLKQLIMVVLLAVFADLLLPTKAMQKYVRVVMGLAIIAVMLQPVLPFFQRDWPSQLADVATRELLDSSENSTSSLPPDVTNMQKLLQSEQSTEAQSLLQEQIGQAVYREFGFRPTRVTISGLDRVDGQPRLQLTVSPANANLRVDVQRWLSRTYAIPVSQISVDAKGGWQ